MIGANGSTMAAPSGAAVVIERTYRAPPEELWALWTTKAGFESWWAPEGFRIEVHVIEAQLGGALVYEMIAEAPQAIAALREAERRGFVVAAADQPAALAPRSRFAEFEPYTRLVLMTAMEPTSGIPPYDHMIEVDFLSTGGRTSMVVTLHPHPEADRMTIAVAVFNIQIARLDRRFTQE
jgi:uncharacterized protein YndB with AHSA1/START domain